MLLLCVRGTCFFSVLFWVSPRGAKEGPKHFSNSNYLSALNSYPIFPERPGHVVNAPGCLFTRALSQRPGGRRGAFFPGIMIITGIYVPGRT